jgi:peptidoglycan/xylan/chitin deacetylase (PgdA/CDA1 family)
MNKIYVTTSWDDGSVHDLKLAELLNKYNVKGTFYIPSYFTSQGDKFSAYGRLLNEEEIQTISQTHEVGGHTFNHTVLKQLSDEKIIYELLENKKRLERITGKTVKMFAYPSGFFDNKISEMVKSVGFSGARTTKKLSNSIGHNPFQLPVSIQVNSFPFRKLNPNHYYWRRLLDPIFGYNKEILRFPGLFFRIYSWQVFAQTFFHMCRKNGGYFHFYGHSWEIEKYNLWLELETFLKFITSQPNILFFNNFEIIDTLINENITSKR